FYLHYSLKKVILKILLMRIPLIFIALFFSSLLISAKSVNKSIDSLIKLIPVSKNQVQLYIKISDHYTKINADSSFSYAEKAYNLAVSNEDKNSEVIALNIMGDIYYDKGLYDESIECYQKALDINILLKNDTNIAASYNFIGMIYEGRADYEKSLIFYDKALDINKRLNYLPSLANNYNNIGMIYFNYGKYDEAIEHYLEAIKIDSILNRFNNLAIDYNNLALAYFYMGDMDVALPLFRRAVKIDLEISNKSSIAPFINNIGLIFFKKEEYDSALFYFHEAIDLSIKLNNIRDAATYQINLGVTYALKLGEFQKGYDMYEKCLEICRANNYLDLVQITYQAYYKTYKKQGNYKKAFEYYEMYSDVKDSIFNEQSQKALEQYRAKYETEKKEKEIELLKKDQKIRNIILYAISGGFLLFLILMIIVFRAYRLKKQAFNLIKMQKEEIQEKNEELNQQNEEIATQRDEIERQKDQLLKTNNQMTDSIRYAKKIQKAVLAPEEHVTKSLPEHFILFLPRDIVSGDFYWATEQGDDKIFAAVDCTGHGVPGAFMSMLGIAFLNEIVNKDTSLDAHEILNKLKQYVINSLHQTGRDGEAQDGMDIALCIINEKKKIMHYAGANNPLWILRNNEIIEYSADKMPIGIFHKANVSFTNHKIPILSEDKIYIFSDGYNDQFGGPNNRKFGKTGLKNKLIEIQSQSMAKQKNILNKTFNEWIESNSQIDDVLVMGIKIN
ncbi:MAG: tetratricopeptide repeat protein, partial [Bacteroidota bacterium]